MVHFSPPQRSPVFAGSPPACEGTPQARTPAPAASSAKRAVPRPRFLTRIAVIEHSMRAVSAPAAPAHHTCCVCPCCACRCRRCPQRSAFVVASRPERCCEPQSPAGPLRRTRVCFTLLSLRKMVSLDATTTSGYNQMVRCDLITCVLARAARHDRRPLARRPSSQRARRMTGSVQRHFRDGRKASTGARRETQEGQDTSLG